MITAGDFLAGGGGVTEAMSQIPGMEVKWVLNHDPIAIRTNLFNHKGVRHFWADLYRQDEHELDPVQLVWASIECTQHSKANGGRAKKLGSYTLGWELVRYIRHLMPLAIGIENVPEFRDWAPTDEDGNPIQEKRGEEFRNWRDTICAMGYEYHEAILNAADFGLPTRRVRYFAFFASTSLNLQVNWPQPTHSRKGTNGLKKWEACKPYIRITDEGNSIFGRTVNPNVPKNKRQSLSPNTLRRIAGGIRRFAPEMAFIFQYYGNGLNIQSLTHPLHPVTTHDRHCLVTLEKTQFVADHTHTDNFNRMEDPLNPQLTRQTKQLITIEKMQFLADYFGRDDTAQSLDGPANTITCENSKHLVTVEKQSFISKHFSGDQHHASSINDPLSAITTVDHNSLVTAQVEREQFVSKFFNSDGKPEHNNSSINDPLGALTTSQKNVLITATQDGILDFDIKMRFLDPDELSAISTFPQGYFSNPRLKLTKKEQIRLIGNAVPPEWARQIIAPVVRELERAIAEKLEKVA